MSKNNISTVISGFTGFLWVMKKVPKVKYPRTYLQMQYTEVNAKGNMTKITARKWKLFSLWSQEETVSKLRFFFKFKCLSKVREWEKLIFAEKKSYSFIPYIWIRTNAVVDEMPWIFVCFLNMWKFQICHEKLTALFL